MRRMSLIFVLIAITLFIFLAGVRVGVQYAGVIGDAAPILTVELASIEL